MVSRHLLRATAPALLSRGLSRPLACTSASTYFSTQGARRTDAPADETSRPDSIGRRHGEATPTLASKMVESAATTFASILVLGLGFAAAGYIYHRSYKELVVRKMVRAFEPGDPVLDLAAAGKDVPHRDHHHYEPDGEQQQQEEDDERWVRRPEQELLDAIVSGRNVGHYFLVLGDKGTGKSSMLLEAMRRIDGDGASMLEAHADLEVVRLRLGKALNYEYHEDYIGGYFSERGPRESTPLLDIERALNKLEKVALRLLQQKRRRRSGGSSSGGGGRSQGNGGGGRPLVVIVNQMHLLRDDDDGRDLLELLQQRAEQWAAAGLVTVVFSSDDYWVYERLKLLATRMEVIPVGDLPRREAMDALRRYRRRYWGEELGEAELGAVYERVGGRLSFLNRVAKSGDMLATCEAIKETEKKWFLNQCWILGMEMDDDVMDQQKWAAAAMLLAQALVAKEKKDEEEEEKKGEKEEEEKDEDGSATRDPAAAGHVLPSYPFHAAQEIMTRCDFIRRLDSLNLFSITSAADVRASSVPMHRAFREICSQPGFDEHLERTVQRISDIESLGRTRELVAKDLVLGGQYEVEAMGRLGGVRVRVKEGEKKD